MLIYRTRKQRAGKKKKEKIHAKTGGRLEKHREDAENGSKIEENNSNILCNNSYLFIKSRPVIPLLRV